MRKIALWMTYLYFFVCPLEFILNSYFGSSAKYIAIVAAAFMLMFFIGTPKQNMRIGSFQMCIVLWAIFEAASYLWTIETRSTSRILVTYLMMAVLVFAVSIFPFTKKEFDNLLVFYTIGAFLLSLVVLFFGQEDMGHVYSGRLTIKIFNSYQDPNELGALILAPTFYSLYRSFKKGNIFWNISFALSFVVMSIAIFLTGSRGAFVSYIVGLLIFVLISSSKKNRLIIITALPVIVTISYLVLRSVLDVYTFNRLFNFDSYTGGTGRISTWTAALSLIVRYPLFGRGVTSYMGYFLEIFNTTSAMHNSYLALLCDVGLVGISLFLYPTVKSFFYAAKQKNATVCAVIASCMLSAFFIDVLTVRYLWNAMIIGMVYYNVNYLQQSDNKTLRADKHLPHNTI